MGTARQCLREAFETLCAAHQDQRLGHAYGVTAGELGQDGAQMLSASWDACAPVAGRRHGAPAATLDAVLHAATAARQAPSSWANTSANSSASRGVLACSSAAISSGTASRASSRPSSGAATATPARSSGVIARTSPQLTQSPLTSSVLSSCGIPWRGFSNVSTSGITAAVSPRRPRARSASPGRRRGFLNYCAAQRVDHRAMQDASLNGNQTAGGQDWHLPSLLLRPQLSILLVDDFRMLIARTAGREFSCSIQIRVGFHNGCFARKLSRVDLSRQH